jgi:prepilin-type N-terminal cleavage/methylation domain-containing protein
MKKLLRHAHSAKGFTLVEVLVALGLAATVLGIMTAFLVNFTRASTAQNAAAGAQQSARAGIEYMLQDIRMAGLDPLEKTDAGVEEITASGRKLRFSSDRCDLPVGSSGCPNPEPDGELDDISEIVTYLYDAGQKAIKRCLYEETGSYGKDESSGACQSILEKVIANPDGTPVFTFLDNGDNLITNNNERSRIRSLILTLTVEEPAGFNKKVARTYSSRVRLRNIGL